MKKLTLLLLLLSATTLYAQDEYYEEEEQQTGIEEREDDHKNHQHRRGDEIKTLARNGHNGGFFGLTFKSTQFNQEPIITVGARTGWIMGRSVAIGFEAHGIVPTAKYDQIIPPDKVMLLGGYGGMFIEPILFSNQVVHLTFPIAGGAGWLGYHHDWEQDYTNYELVEDDVFWYVEPGVAIEVNVSKNFRMAFGASQRFTQELELSNTPEGAFDNRNYFLTMKFGRF